MIMKFSMRIVEHPNSSNMKFQQFTPVQNYSKTPSDLRSSFQRIFRQVIIKLTMTSFNTYSHMRRFLDALCEFGGLCEYVITFDAHRYVQLKILVRDG